MGRRGEGVVIIIIQVVVVVEWVRVEAWMESSLEYFLVWEVVCSLGWSNGGSSGRRMAPQTATAAAPAPAVAAVAAAPAAVAAVTWGEKRWYWAQGRAPGLLWSAGGRSR